jgi:hypothetical protein
MSTTNVDAEESGIAEAAAVLAGDATRKRAGRLDQATSPGASRRLRQRPDSLRPTAASAAEDTQRP